MHPFWPFHHFHLHHHHHHHHHHRHHHDDGEDPSVSVSASLSTRSSSSCLATESSKKRRRTASVSFFPQATQYDHIHLSDLTDEEKANTWYSRSELHAIHEENHETVQWIMQGCCGPTKVQFCSRGMENKTPMGIRMRMRHRMESMEPCIRYQLSEWNHGRDACPERVAEIYSRHTQTSAHVARLAAKMDRENLLRDTEEEDAGKIPEAAASGSGMTAEAGPAGRTAPKSPAAAA